MTLRELMEYKLELEKELEKVHQAIQQTKETQRHEPPALPRMRTAKECYDLIHEADPESRVSLTYIRSLANSGKVTAHRVGNRCLINYDALLDYLANPDSEDNTYYG